MYKTFTAIILSLLLVGCNPNKTTLKVKEVEKDKVILSWIAPTEYTDGTPLPIDVIGGYKVYYGSTPSNYNVIIDITTAYKTEVEVTNLIPNRYYAVVSCYLKDGTESRWSNSVSFETK